MPELVPGPGEVVVDLRAAALNRRDLRVIAGGWPGVAGAASCPAPTARASCARSAPAWAASPRATRSSSCRRSTGATTRACSGPGFQILGGPDDGTFAEQVRVPAANVFPKPARLPFESAAALPLAGLTAWRALFTRGGLALRADRAGARRRRGHVDVRRAVRARGGRARVRHVELGRASSRARVELGAEAGFDYRAEGWEEEVVERSGGGVDLVIDSAGTWAAERPRACARAAAWSSSAAPPSPTAELDVRSFYFKQIDLRRAR